MRKFIQSLNFKLTDIAFFIGLGFGIVLCVFLFDTYEAGDLLKTSYPVWLVYLIYFFMAASFGTFIYFEFKAGNGPKRRVEIIYLFVIILNLIITLAQPNEIVNYVEVKLWNKELPFHKIIEVITPINLTTKIFFCFGFAAFMMLSYQMLFIWPKRIKSTNIINFIGYIIYGGVGLLILLSFITEFPNYIDFISTLFKNFNYNEIEKYAAKSILNHRNVFGFSLMLGLIFALLNYSIDKKKYHLFIGLFFYFEMWFTFCKSGLLLSTLGILLYVYFRLLLYFKNNKKAIIILASLVATLIVLTIIFIFASEKFREIVGELTLGGHTLLSRRLIWENILDLLKPAWWIAGRGFGVVNVVIKDMNYVSHEEITCNPHSWFFASLGTGGIVMVLFYLANLTLGIYVCYKIFKKNKEMGFVLVLAILLFTVYALMEAFYYCVIFFIMIALFLYFYYYQEQEKHIY